MAHNYRDDSGRSGYRGGEQRYGSHRDDRSQEQDRRHGAEQGRADVRNRGRTYYEGNRFDEADRWSQGRSGEEFDDLYARDRGTTTSSWHEDQRDRGGYFNTGSYVDDGGASRGFGDDFERARAQVQRRYGQPAERSWRNQPYDSGYPERSSWDYPQRAGSGQSGGAYSYDPGYRSDFSSYAGGERSHRGRGPQGYQRSDERLKEIVCERLTDDPHIDASNITVEVSGQTVKLTGTVDDRSTKYQVEELVERLGGIEDIDNQLRVKTQSGAGMTQRSGMSTSTAGTSKRN